MKFRVTDEEGNEYNVESIFPAGNNEYILQVSGLMKSKLSEVEEPMSMPYIGVEGDVYDRGREEG